MLIEPKLNLFKELISDASSDELVWMNGFLSGILSAKDIAPAKQNTATARLSVIYATETGNAKALATKFAAEGKKSGIKVKLAPAETYKIKDIEKEENVVVVISTQGDGEPPLSAAKFFHALHNTALQLPDLKFGVLALGDSSYPLFCQAGIDVDRELELRGAQRIFPLQKCDTNYETDATQWFANVISALKGSTHQASDVPVAKKQANARKIYNGIITTNINLNDEGSLKETHHIEISAEDLAYEPGDAIGIAPVNSRELVQEILKTVAVDKNEQVTWRDQHTDIDKLLANKVQVAYLPERVVKKYAEITGNNIPATRMDLKDLLKIYPVSGREEFFRVVEVLEPITPRLYSISSSLEATADEVHITVALDRFSVNDKEVCGHCSDYLTGLPVGTQVDFYVHSNKNFRLPAADADVIMIGPGTGIAPFRSFLFERDAQGADGRNWLFFGEQHFTTDFLYQTEIQSFLDTGVLTKFNGAFSRDQEHKVYVQHKMLQHAKELFSWIENGAHVYVCGAREPMSMDVENALLSIISREKSINESESKQYFEKLVEDGRYHKDVY